MKHLKIIAIISAAAIAAIGVTGGSAKADSSPWEAVYLHAISGNGCASYAADQHLAPIISEPCSKSATWYFRDLTRSGPESEEDQYEFVDSTKTYALGFSDGAVKLETPNDNSTYLYMFSGALSAGQLWLPGSIQVFPNGAGDPLQIIKPSSPNTLNDWIACPVANNDPTCGG
jgi:hypothetical protein